MRGTVLRYVGFGIPPGGICDSLPTGRESQGETALFWLLADDHNRRVNANSSAEEVCVCAKSCVAFTPAEYWLKLIVATRLYGWKLTLGLKLGKIFPIDGVKTLPFPSV